jgi:hypothetical protein
MTSKKLPRNFAKEGTIEETYDKVIKDLRVIAPRPHGLLAEFQERKIIAMAGRVAFKMHESGLRDAYETLADAMLALRREVGDNEEFPANREEVLIYRSYIATIEALQNVRAVIDARRKPPILDVESSVRPLNGD